MQANDLGSREGRSLRVSIIKFSDCTRTGSHASDDDTGDDISAAKDFTSG